MNKIIFNLTINCIIYAIKTYDLNDIYLYSPVQSLMHTTLKLYLYSAFYVGVHNMHTIPELQLKLSNFTERNECHKTKGKEGGS